MPGKAEHGGMSVQEKPCMFLPDSNITDKRQNDIQNGKWQLIPHSMINLEIKETSIQTKHNIQSKQRNDSQMKFNSKQTFKKQYL